MDTNNFEQFKSRQHIRYELTTTLNDEVMYHGEFADVESLISDGVSKAERAVEHQIGIEFDDNANMILEQERD